MIELEQPMGKDDLLPPSLSINPMSLFEKAKNEGRPLYCAAPMVRYSKLAFRETVAQYGCDLVWTPMILAREFNRSSISRDADFTLSPTQPPTILQVAVNSPLEMTRCTLLSAPYVNGIDLNCGCPQSWACSSQLGSFLMTSPTLVSSLIIAAKTAFSSLGKAGENKTVSVKIRIHKDLEETKRFIKEVEKAGVDFITIHGRTRNTRSSQPVNLDAIQYLASFATVPIIANGDVFTLSDAHRIASETGVQGVMAARGLLENPGLFAGNDTCEWETVEWFMNRVVKATIPFKLVVHHLSEMVGSDRGQQRGPLMGKEERMKLMECRNMLEVIDLLDGFREIRRLCVDEDGMVGMLAGGG